MRSPGETPFSSSTATRVGRDPSEIERTVAIRQPLIREARSVADKALDAVFVHNDFEPWLGAGNPGTVDDVVELCAQYVVIRYRHLIFQFLAPYDEETMARLAAEVKPGVAAVG